MRLLIFSPYFQPHVGGVESYVSELNEALLKAGTVNDITVLAPLLPPGAPTAESRADNYQILRYPAVEVIPNFPVPKLWSTAFWRAVRLAHPRRADVIVGHTRFFVSSALALMLARLAQRPVLHVEHGSDFVQLGSRTNRAIARAYDHLLGRLVLRRADAAVAVSQAAAEFVWRLARRRAEVVYRGISAGRLQSTKPDAEILAFANGRPVITYVGRLIDGKGVADLVRAFGEVHEGNPVLCLVGDGPRRSDLRLLAATCHVDHRVLFLGTVDEQRALAAILASDIVVNPSYTEGLPTAVLEAALLGRAIIATSVGGTNEVIAPGRGVLIPPRDPARLASELRRLIEQPRLRAELGAAARAFAHARFDWDRSAGLFVEIASCVAHHRSRYQST